MVSRLFESFREWAFSARRRKDSKKPSGGYTLEGARESCGGGGPRKTASDEIILRSEPLFGEFIAKQGSSEAS